MRRMRNILIVIIATVFGACAQDGAMTLGETEIFEPVKWKYEVNALGNQEYEFIFKATIDDSWHLYSQFIANDGPVPTSFGFDSIPELEFIGSVDERGEMEVDFDPNFQMELKWYSHQVDFVQKVKLNGDDVKFSGYLEFMTCNDERCLPPEFIEFDIELGSGGVNIKVKELEIDSAGNNLILKLPSIDLDNPVNDCGEKREEQTLWGIFMLGLLGGFIALLTPCVFPMIPLTVSYFTKGSADKKKGIFNSVLYGFFIMLIYFLLSTPFHLLPDIDPEVLNRISTNPWLNLTFFAVFVIFAVSFFGYFEITLPSKWTNKADSASDIGGMIGIFFMALTLALVSFSCTGPILGTLLAGTLSSESAGFISILGMDFQLVAVKLSVGMTGFGLALGLPFALFAAFPGWLQSLPQSGGWLNTVKVLFGFIEVALAVKFFSNADLVEQWGLLKRETFFALWFIVAIATGLYFFNKIKFPHDSPGTKVSKSGFVMGTFAIAFALYLLPGMWSGTWWSHNALSGFPPPKYYSYFPPQEEFEIFYDYDEGMAYAQSQNKPVMIDFTGWACVNCRKMEDNVWPEDSVKKILKEDYIIISLYVDQKKVYPLDEQYVVEVPKAEGGTRLKKIRTVGDKWSTLQTLTFASNSQPYYVLLNTDTILMANPIGYNYAKDVDQFVDYLKCGLEAFSKMEQPAEEPSSGGSLFD